MQKLKLFFLAILAVNFAYAAPSVQAVSSESDDEVTSLPTPTDGQDPR